MSTDLPLEVNRALKRPSSRGKMAEKGLFTAFGGSGPVRGTNNVVHSICSLGTSGAGLFRDTQGRSYISLCIESRFSIYRAPLMELSEHGFGHCLPHGVVRVSESLLTSPWAR